MDRICHVCGQSKPLMEAFHYESKGVMCKRQTCRVCYNTMQRERYKKRTARLNTEDKVFVVRANNSEAWCIIFCGKVFGNWPTQGAAQAALQRKQERIKE